VAVRNHASSKKGFEGRVADPDVGDVCLSVWLAAAGCAREHD
jgi:hypothetical protein